MQGERISKTVFDAAGKSTTTYFLYSGNQLDAEVNALGQITAHYFYFNHAPMVKLEYAKHAFATGNFGASVTRWLRLHDVAGDGTIYAIHTDQLGTPQAATNGKKQLVWRASYTAFGDASITENRITLNLRLPGQYHDIETGTHYNLHRDYDPKAGRYLTSDPIGLKGGTNLYAYESSRPLKEIDPLGLKVWLAERPIDAPIFGWVGGHTWLVLEPDHPDELEKYYSASKHYNRYYKTRIVLRGGPSKNGTNGDYGNLIGDDISDSATEWRKNMIFLHLQIMDDV